MNRSIFICLTLFCFLSTIVSAQLSDLAKIEYTALPESSDGGASFSRSGALLNFPIKLKKEGSFFIVGADYNHISFDVDESLVNFDPKELSDFNQLSFTFGYTFKINKDWRFGAQVQPGYSTNLDVANITFDDAIISGDIVLIKDKKSSDQVKKPNRLIFGIRVSGTSGFPVLPFISYYRKFHPKWSYNFGVPKTQLQYYIAKRHRLKLIARIDGFRSSLQNSVVAQPDGERAEVIRQRLVLGGLRYEFKFTDNLEFYINGSYIIDNSLELRDRSTNTLFDFQEDNNFYIKTGVRFKIQ